MGLRTAVLLASTLTVGLMAGLFYSYSYSVMPGLARSDDRTFVLAMQRINVAIVNGWFLVCFLGAIVLTALAVLLHLGGDHRRVLPWLVAALVLYVATIAITGIVNVPLNNALVAAGDVDRIGDLAAVRERFETTWVRWNHVRSATSVASFACLLAALEGGTPC